MPVFDCLKSCEAYDLTNIMAKGNSQKSANGSTLDFEAQLHKPPHLRGALQGHPETAPGVAS